MVSVAITSGKGGVGKSTLTANLAVAMAELNCRVTILDADIDMANLSLLLGLDTTPKTLHDYLCGRAEPEEIVYSRYGVNIVPSGLTLDSLLRADVEKLSEIIQILKGTEVLLVDSPAGLGRAVLQAIASCDTTIIVTNPEVSSVSDALKIKLVAERLGGNVTGTVVNRVPRKLDSCIHPTDIAAVLSCRLIGAVPDAADIVRQSVNAGVPFIVSHPDAEVSRAVKRIAATLIGAEVPEERESPFRRFFRKLLRR